LERDLRESEAIRVREFEEYKKLTQSEMIKLENQLKDYNFFMAERDKMESENDKLKKSLDDEK
jgi:cell shape-determining protein MreC